MKLLITGGTGFVGKHLCNLLSDKYEIVVLGRSPQFNSAKNLNGLKYIQTAYDRPHLDEIFSSSKPDAIIHLAAKRLQADQTNPNEYIQNLEIANNLFESALLQSITNIVCLSTIGVYGNNNNLPWTEETETEIGNPYSLSKLWVEKSADYFNKKGLRIKQLRVAQCIGLGERDGFLLQIYLRKSLNKEVLDVFGENRGRRQYIYVKDLVSAIEKALLSGEKAGIYNIGMDETYSFLDVAQTINETFENNSEIKIHSEKKADERIYQMSIEKTKRELNWVPQYDLNSTYQDMKADLERD